MECSYKCAIEFPKGFCDKLTADIGVDLLEVPSYAPVNIINREGKYIVKVCVELNSIIKKLLCAKWCVCVAAEGIGNAPEFEDCKELPMDNCNPEPDCIEFEISGERLLAGDGAKCGRVFYLVVTVVALDNCESKPIGIAGFCRVGPVMAYG